MWAVIVAGLILLGTVVLTVNGAIAQSRALDVVASVSEDDGNDGDRDGIPGRRVGGGTRDRPESDDDRTA